jgi:predicted GIY-YIG superfamily endonuclease
MGLQYRQENKEAISERDRQHYQENKEAISEQQKQYRQAKKASQPACVYEIINTINNKLYVGQTTRGKIRWMQHLSNLRGGYHENPNLQADFNQYGEDAFEWRIIKEFETKDEQLLITEESRIMNQYIDEGKNLYNVTFIKEVG